MNEERQKELNELLYKYKAIETQEIEQFANIEVGENKEELPKK